MMPKDDWRRMGQEGYLMGARLYRVPFIPQSEQRDHEHCVFCFDKFYLHSGHPEFLREGYCTEPINSRTARWICPQCFRDFREEFGWTVDGEEKFVG